MIEPLPCPFCGAPPERIAFYTYTERSTPRGMYRRIQCSDRVKCMADGPLAPKAGESDEMKEAAIRLWNNVRRRE